MHSQSSDLVEQKAQTPGITFHLCFDTENNESEEIVCLV